MKQDPAVSLRSLNFGGTANTAVPPLKTLEGTVPPCPPMIYATALAHRSSYLQSHLRERRFMTSFQVIDLTIVKYKLSQNSFVNRRVQSVHSYIYRIVVQCARMSI